MTDFAGLAQPGLDQVAYFIGDDSSAPLAYGRALTPANPVGDDYFPGFLDEMFNLVAGPGKTNTVLDQTFSGLWSDMTVVIDWFENYHVIPRSFDFGNILSAQASPMEVFSGYRTQVGEWTSFVNNAGAGTTLDGQPALPAVLSPLEGFSMTLEVGINGNPSVDSTLDFQFDTSGALILVPIVLNRVVLFPIRPELPYREKLGFLTDMLIHEDSSEQRLAIRKNPRQVFEWEVRTDDDTFDDVRLDTLMFEWQARTWGVPMWHEATSLTVAATIGQLTINVDTTDDADYRIGGLVLVFQDSGTFDVQTVSSFTTTTITLVNGILNNYSIPTVVLPLRTGNLQNNVPTSRFPSGDQSTTLRFRVLDNDANLADTTGWPTENGKVLLDDCNVLRGSTKPASYLRDIVVVDNTTGLTTQDSPWDHGLMGYPLTLRSDSKAETWRLRKLMHAFRGRQVSFYVPTFRKDMLLDTELTSASTDLNIVNMGYVQFIHERQPRNRIWIRMKDGTILTRVINSSVETSLTRETLVVDSSWPSTFAIADVDRISYLEEVRYDTDTIEFRYTPGGRQVYVTAPVHTLAD